jgi:hypothetical protein
MADQIITNPGASEANHLDRKVAVAKDSETGGMWVGTYTLTGQPQGNAKRLSREEAEDLYHRIGQALGL